MTPDRILRLDVADLTGAWPVWGGDDDETDQIRAEPDRNSGNETVTETTNGTD